MIHGGVLKVLRHGVMGVGSDYSLLDGLVTLDAHCDGELSVDFDRPVALSLENGMGYWLNVS